MSTRIETMECFPKPIDFFGTTIPAPEVNHGACPGGQHTPGVMGGWHCPCECHLHKADEDVRSWLQRRLLEELWEALNKAPWWCLICGQGENYEGDRPDDYLPPPSDHVCPRSTTFTPPGIV